MKSQTEMGSRLEIRGTGDVPVTEQWKPFRIVLWYLGRAQNNWVVSGLVCVSVWQRALPHSYHPLSTVTCTTWVTSIANKVIQCSLLSLWVYWKVWLEREIYKWVSKNESLKISAYLDCKIRESVLWGKHEGSAPPLVSDHTRQTQAKRHLRRLSCAMVWTGMNFDKFTAAGKLSAWM